jgi:RimJ/RimL family protein N-acetyltransferase
MTLPIVTGRLVLRSLADRDVEDVLAMVSQPSIARVTTNIEGTADGVKRYIDELRSYRPFEEGFYHDLALERDGRVIGLLGLKCQDHRQGMIGWGLATEYRGHGYATEGARALITLGFSELGLHRIYATTSHVNKPSWRVMERLGMRREARLREAEFRDGAWIDVLIYAVLADEWAG